MNIIFQFLRLNWQRLGLDRYGSQAHLSCFLATPKFRASSHVIFFILTYKGTDPILIAKVPRLPGDMGSLDREVSNLRKIQACRTGGFNSIPRVVAYQDFQKNRILIETALAGQAMSSSMVRRKSNGFVQAVVSWLIEFHLATREFGARRQGWFNRLVERPEEQFVKVMPVNEEELRLINSTQKLTGELRHRSMPLVFEHGDFGPPNILLRKDGQIGVVDWELAEPRGLPAVDLFFLLTLVSFGKRGAKNNQDYLAAFREAFFGRNAWAKSYVLRYAEKIDLPPETLKPLFIACWSRYVINIAERLSERVDTKEILSDETVAWLRQNRYYALWRYTIDHIDEINFVD